MNNKLYLWRLIDTEYSTDIEGLFLATEEEISLINNQDIDLGEALGDYSEVIIAISDKNLKRIEIDDFTILQLLETFGDRTLSGYNPLRYFCTHIECQDCLFIEHIEYSYGYSDILECPKCQSKNYRFLVREEE